MPYSRKAQFRHKRIRSPRLFRKTSFRNVPISHTSYQGKYRKEGNRAIVGKLKKTDKWAIQSILIKKNKKV